jgi:hypothetical protein
MKYLVVKGWLGFGDRLETLKMCVWYAQQHKLQIYVDWTDSIWSHGGESFYTYFNIVNMPTLKSLDDIPEDATVYPAFWKDKLKTPITQERVDAQKVNGINVNCVQKNEVRPEDVVVCSSIGMRNLFYDASFFTNCVKLIDRRIIDEVKRRSAAHNLPACIGFHVRGTDRVRNSVRRDLSIQHMALNAVTAGAFSGKPMITVGDDNESITIWKRFFPQTVVLSSLSLSNTSAKGNHNAKSTDLKTTKDNMNVDMLVDFFTLASCARVISTYKDSRFAHEARRLGPYIRSMMGNEISLPNRK